MAKTPETESTAINIITDGTTIKGDIIASGDFRLDGTLEGNIQLNGKLVVGDSGVVNELLSLHTSARVRGDILINKLSIEPGATFSGKCRMIDEVRAQHEEQAPETPAEQQAE